MDVRRAGCRWIVILTVTLLAAAGCGDLEGEAPPADSQLYHHSEFCEQGQQRCVIGTTTGDHRQLAVRLVDADDEPVQGSLVEFTLESDDGIDADLSADGALTDADGVAAATFRPHEGAGEIDVTAEVQHGDDVNSVQWQINLTSKGAASYIVEFDYQGDSEIGAVQPLLYDDAPSCETLLEDFFEDDTWPNADLSLEPSFVQPDGSIDDASYHPVTDGDRFTVVGLAHRQEGAQPVDIAYGCDDTNEAVTDATDVTVDVELYDHLPHLGDRYDTTNHLLMTESLPGPVQTIVDLLAQLAENPASLIIGGEDYTGLVDDVLIEYLPGDTVEEYLSPLLENETVIGIIQGFINEIIDGLMPGWVDDAQQIVHDVTNVLEEFTVHGQFALTEAPTRHIDEEGRTVGHLEDVHHIWDEVVFEWGRNCGDPGTDGYEECAMVPIDAAEVTDESSGFVEGHFDATIRGPDRLEIHRHGLSLNYGELMVAAFEQLVLQRLFEGTDTVDDLIDVSLGDCEQLATTVADEDSGLADVAESLCEILADQVRQALYDYFLDTLDEAGTDQFELMTPEDAACSLEQPDEYIGSSWPGAPLPYIETMGTGGQGMNCDWRVEAELPIVTDPAVVDGEFEAQLVE